MPARTPKYRLHRPSGQAVVTINGRDFYLGPHGKPESRAEYERLVGEWMAAGRRLPTVEAADLSVNELLVGYLRWCEGYYGAASKEPANIKLAIRPLAKLYGHTPAVNFGPLSLKVVREEYVRGRICRNEVNKRCGRIVRVFKWGVENELVPPSVHQALRAVPGLRLGRCEARESEPVRPVPETYIDAIQPHVLPPVWAMIQLQLLTGMRPGEVVAIRGRNLNMTGRVWTYSPDRHKTAWHGHQRTIYFGPKAQEVVRPWLKTDLNAVLFSPAEAVSKLYADRTIRKTKAQTFATLLRREREERRRQRRRPKEMYNVGSYGRAIARGCEKADAAAHKADPSIPKETVIVPSWHPHQLRHNAATRLRKEFGLDVARVILGHRSTAVTEIYAEVDHGKALEVMQRVG